MFFNKSEYSSIYNTEVKPENKSIETKLENITTEIKLENKSYIEYTNIKLEKHSIMEYLFIVDTNDKKTTNTFIKIPFDNKNVVLSSSLTITISIMTLIILLFILNYS